MIMKTPTEILTKLINRKEANEALSRLTSDSRVSVWRNVLFVIASSISYLTELFDEHKKDVTDLANSKEPRKELWYQNIALAFQYGHELVEDKHYYDNSNRTEEEVALSKIVKYSAVNQEKDKSTLYIKVANENKQPLSVTQATAFEAYMNDVADLGVHLTIVNQPADDLKLELDIYYDPTILNSQGERLDGSGNTNAQDTIDDYISNLEINQQYVGMHLIDALQKVKGINIAEIIKSDYKYDVIDWQPLTARYTPKSGFLSITPENLKINWKI